MDFKSRIYASSNGTTIDAIGRGQYLVCKPSGCTKVKGLHKAHAALRHCEVRARCKRRPSRASLTTELDSPMDSPLSPWLPIDQKDAVPLARSSHA